MDHTVDDPDPHATISGMRCMRVAVVKLGEMSPYILDVLSGMLSDIKCVNVADVAALQAHQYMDGGGKFQLCLNYGRFELTIVNELTRSKWQDIVASKRIVAVLVLVHARRNTGDQLKEVLHKYKLLQQKFPQSRCVMVDPDSEPGKDENDASDSIPTIRYLPWDSQGSTKRKMLALVHEVLTGVVQDMHQTMNSPQKKPLYIDSEKQESKQKDKQSARWLKHCGDLCLLLSDFKSAHSYYKQSAGASDRAGDTAWQAAALEGSACAVYSLNTQNGVPKGLQATEPWVEEVTKYLSDAVRNYESSTSTPQLRIEAGLRYTKFIMTLGGQERQAVLQSIFDCYAPCKQLQEQTAIITKLAELCITIGCHRKAVLLLRLAAQQSQMRHDPLRSLKLYIPAAQLLKVPLKFNESRMELELCEGDGAKGWDVLQLVLLKEMMQVAQEISKTYKDCKYYHQLALYTLTRYADAVDQQWCHSVLLSLMEAETGPALAPLLPISLEVQRLAEHLRPVYENVRTGKEVFSYNPHLKKKEAVTISWIAGTTGQVNITLTNPFNLQLTLGVVGLRTVEMARVICKDNVILPAKKSVTVTVGLQPLNPGLLTITAVDVVVSVSETVDGPPKHLSPLQLPVNPSMKVPVVDKIPILSVFRKGASEHFIVRSLVTGQVSKFTLVIQNIGSLPVEILTMSLSDKSKKTKGAIMMSPCVRYDAEMLAKKLPLAAGAEIEVPMEIEAPVLPVSDRTHVTDLTVLYGRSKEHKQLVGKEAVRNLEGSWETYIYSQREAALPLHINISDGLFCSSCIKSECGRFFEVKVTNHFTTGIYLVNHKYQKHLLDPDRVSKPFIVPRKLEVRDDQNLIECPREFHPTPSKIFIPAHTAAQILIPLLQFTGTVKAELVYLEWKMREERVGRVPVCTPAIKGGGETGDVKLKQLKRKGEMVLEEDGTDVEMISVKMEVKREDGDEEGQTVLSASTFVDTSEIRLEINTFYQVEIRLVRTGSDQSSSASFPVHIGFSQKSSRPNTVASIGLGDAISFEGTTTASLTPGSHTHTLSLATHTPGVILLQIQLTTPSTRHVHTFPVRCYNPEAVLTK